MAGLSLNATPPVGTELPGEKEGSSSICSSQLAVSGVDHHLLSWGQWLSWPQYFLSAYHIQGGGPSVSPVRAEQKGGPRLLITLS